MNKSEDRTDNVQYFEQIFRTLLHSCIKGVQVKLNFCWAAIFWNNIHWVKFHLGLFVLGSSFLFLDQACLGSIYFGLKCFWTIHHWDLQFWVKFLLGIFFLGKISSGANFLWDRFLLGQVSFFWVKHVLGQFTLDQIVFGPITIGSNCFGSNFFNLAISWVKFPLGKITQGRCSLGKITLDQTLWTKCLGHNYSAPPHFLFHLNRCLLPTPKQTWPTIKKQTVRFRTTEFRHWTLYTGLSTTSFFFVKYGPV